MTSQKAAGTKKTGYVTVDTVPGPRECGHCEHYTAKNSGAGLCDGQYVMADPELSKQRAEDGRVNVKRNAYCWFYEAKP